MPIIRLIEEELDKYPEWSAEWVAIYNLLGKVQTEMGKGKI